MITPGISPEVAVGGLPLIFARPGIQENRLPVHWSGDVFSNVPIPRDEFIADLIADPMNMAIWADEKRFVIAWVIG